jgi:hypothetical protein
VQHQAEPALRFRPSAQATQADCRLRNTAMPAERNRQTESPQNRTGWAATSAAADACSSDRADRQPAREVYCVAVWQQAFQSIHRDPGTAMLVTRSAAC